MRPTAPLLLTSLLKLARYATGALAVLPLACASTGDVDPHADLDRGYGDDDDDDNAQCRDGNADRDRIRYRRHVQNLSYTRVDGDRLAYFDCGDAGDEVLILLHGVPTSSLLYRQIAPEIAERSGYRVIALDMLGFGASDKPDREGAYVPAAQAERVFAFADAIGVDRFVLGVHDIGGFVGWEMLQQDPERLDGLVVADTTAYAEGLTPLPRVAEIGAGATTPEEVFGPLDGDRRFARVIAREFLEMGIADPDDVTRSLVRAYAVPLSQGFSEAFIQFLEVIFPALVGEQAQRRQALAAFDRPVIVIHGAEDRFFDADTVVPLFAEDFALSDDEVFIVPGAGHFIQEDDPEAYIDAVVPFLERL